MKAALHNRSIIILSIMTLSLLAGCITAVDCASYFHIFGRVLEANSNTPLDNVEIYFIDRGLDSVMSKDEEKGTQLISFSGQEGYFDLNFYYGWGYEQGFLRLSPKNTFDLVFRRQGYVEKIISYNLKKLPYDDATTQVDVGPITLVPE